VDPGMSTSGSARRRGGAVVAGAAHDAEAHDVGRRPLAAGVDHGHLGADEHLREVDHHVEPLPRRRLDARPQERRGEQAAVRADLGEREVRAARHTQREAEAAGVGRVEDAEPVAGGVHLAHRLRGAVGEHDVADTPAIHGGSTPGTSRIRGSRAG